MIFLDEIDSRCPSRDDSSREMTHRIIAQFLQQMDELSPEIVVLGVTSRPHKLDASLRRSGRFDSEILVGIPDETARRAIINVVTARV